MILIKYSFIDKAVLYDTVLSVMENGAIRENLDKGHKMIEEAPGNRGGAELITDYFEKYSRC